MESAGPDDLDRADSVWNRAAAADADDEGDPLCCRSEWQISFHENLAPDQTVVVRTSDDSIAAFAVHRQSGLGIVLTPFEWGWRFGRPVLGPSGLELLQLLLAEVTAATRIRVSVLMTGMLPDRPTSRRIVHAFRRWRCWPPEDQQASVASLEGGLDGYLSRRSGLMRRNLRKAALRAEARGVRFERCIPASAAEADAAYARVLAVESRSWKGRESTGVVDPDVTQFYRRLLMRLAGSGLARVVFARHEAADIGFLFGGLSGGVFRAQQCSFADQWRPYSIGNLLQLETLGWLSETGADWYHMGPTMDYKLHWAEQRRTLRSMLFVPG